MAGMGEGADEFHTLMDGMGYLGNRIHVSLDFLCKTSTNLQEVLVHLTSNNVITQHESEVVENQLSDYTRFRQLFTFLIQRVGRGHNSRHFVDAFQKSGNEHILKELRSAVVTKDFAPGTLDTSSHNIRFNVQEQVSSFIGRKDFLRDLHQHILKSQRTTADVSTTSTIISRICVVTGLGGIGKTETIRSYIHSYGHCYQHVVWIDAEEHTTAENQFRKLELQLSSKDTDNKAKDFDVTLKDIYDHLCTSHTLIVFDNAEALHDSDPKRPGVPRFLPKSLPPTFIKPVIIITSRQLDWPDIQSMPLLLWTPHESSAFIFRQLKLEENDVNVKEATTLSKTFGGLPLALQAIVAVIGEESKRNELKGKDVYTINHFLSDYNNEKRKVLEKRPPGSPNTETLMFLWKLSLDKVRQQPHGHLATQILNVMAHLSPTNIPKDLFFFIFNSEDSDSFVDAVKLLVDYSFVHNFKTHFSIHRVLQDVTIAHLDTPTEERPKDWDALLSTPPLIRITKELTEYWPKVLKSSEAYDAVHDNLVHVTMSHVLPEAEIPSEKELPFIEFIKFVFEEIKQTRWVDAEKCCRVLLNYFTRGARLLNFASLLVESPNYNDIVYFQEQLGRILRLMGRIKEADDILKDMLSIFNNPEDQQWSTDVIPEIQDSQMENDVIKFKSSLIDQMSNLLGPTHKVVMAMNKLDLDPQKSGQLNEAKTLIAEMIAEIIEKMEKDQGPLHSETLIFKQVLASLMQDEGESDESYTIMREVMEILEKEVGPLIADLQSSNSCMADPLNGQKKLELIRLFDSLTDRLGKLPDYKHHKGLVAKSDKATVLVKQRHLDKAKDMLCHVLEQQESLLGPNCFAIVVTKLKLASVLLRQGKDAEASKLYEEAMELLKNQVGLMHSSTLKNKNVIGWLCQKMGDIVNTDLITEEVLAAGQATLPRDHPSTKHTLLVHDNAEALHNSDHQRHGDLHLMSLPLWTQQDSRAFIFRQLKLEESEANTKDAGTLSETFDGLPLALQAAVAVILQESKRNELPGKGVYTIQHLLSDYNQEKRKVLKKRPPGSPDAPPLMFLLRVSLDKLRQQPDGNLATEILDVMAHRSPTNIPKELLFFILNYTDEHTLRKAMALLVDYYFVQNSRTCFSIHHMLQDVTFADLEASTNEGPKEGYLLLLTHPLRRITTAMMKYWPTLLKSSEVFDAVHENLIHVTVSHVLPKAQNPSETDLHFIEFIEFVLEEIKNTRRVEAEKCCRVLISYFTSSTLLSNSASLFKSPQFKEVQYLRMQLTWILQTMGKYKEAVDICQESLSFFNSLKDQEDVISEILDEKHLLASILISQKEYEEAIKLNSSVIDLRSKLHGPNHEFTLATKNNLALALHNSGRLSEAKTLHAQILEVRMKDLGPLHLDTLTTKHNMAMIFVDEGCYDDALEMLREVVEGRERKLGPLHVDTLNTNHCIAYVLDKQGEDEDALRIYESLISIYEKMFSASHPDCLAVKNNMALILGRQGKVEYAKELLRQVLDTQERLLGPSHISTLSTKHCMAEVLVEEGKYAEALKLYEEVLELYTKQLGYMHPDTLETNNEIGWLHLNMGNFRKARRIAKEVLAARKATLPSDHPDYKDTEELYEKSRLRNNPKGNAPKVICGRRLSPLIEWQMEDGE